MQPIRTHSSSAVSAELLARVRSLLCEKPLDDISPADINILNAHDNDVVHVAMLEVALQYGSELQARLSGHEVDPVSRARMLLEHVREAPLFAQNISLLYERHLCDAQRSNMPAASEGITRQFIAMAIFGDLYAAIVASVVVRNLCTNMTRKGLLALRKNLPRKPPA